MLAAGSSYRALAAKFPGLSRDQLHRHHRRGHVAPAKIANCLAGVETIRELKERAVAENGAVIDYLASLRSILMGAIVRNAEANSASSLMMLSGRMIQTLEAIGRITGEIEKNNPSISVTTNVAVMSDPRMLQLQSGLLAIARQIPEARAPIVALLRDLDAKPSGSLKEAFRGPSGRDAALGLEKPAHELPMPPDAARAGPPLIEGDAA
jgi:hypothetical protein